MALTLDAETSQVVSIGDYLDHMRKVDLRDEDSVAATAPMLRALSNDRGLVVRELNRLIKTQFRGEVSPSAQVIYLGRGDGFFVRANIWPSMADVSSGRVYQDQFSYHVAHDHNYDFMTVGHHGPGYVTEIYEYDFERIEGVIGEPVDIRFLERKLFTRGMVMLYRASRDLHIQYPPEDLSITLNLMIHSPEVQARDQYFFDLERRVISDYSSESDGSRRAAVLTMAAQLGDGDTRQLLEDLAMSHPSRRTRLTAWQSLVQLEPARAESIWERAARDPAPVVVHAARSHLALLEKSPVG